MDTETDQEKRKRERSEQQKRDYETQMQAVKAFSGKGAIVKGAEEINIVPMQIRKMRVTLVAISPLMTHAFSEKAKKQIRDKQQKKAKDAKAAKDPQADFEAAKYLTPDGVDALPALAIKAAIVNAARFADDLKMTVLRGAIFVEGDLLPIRFRECVMREDTVRVGMGTTDLRYRPEYHDWEVDAVVQFNSRVLSKEQVVNLISLAGFSVGLCEWRPERNGQHGRFTVGEIVDLVEKPAAKA